MHFNRRHKVTKVEMTDVSACGRIVFHIPWCPEYVSLIPSRFRDFVFTFVFDLPTSHTKFTNNFDNPVSREKLITFQNNLSCLLK